jgi:hypothetical protein
MTLSGVVVFYKATHKAGGSLRPDFFAVFLLHLIAFHPVHSHHVCHFGVVPGVRGLVIHHEPEGQFIAPLLQIS